MHPFLRVAVPAALLAVAPLALAGDARPALTWRPATAADLARLTAARDPAPRRALPRPIAAAPAQRAYVDPVTSELVAAPVVPPEPEDEPAARALQAPLTLERNADGFLHVDTSAYQMRATATLDANGAVHVDCVDTRHDHADATTEAPR